MPKRVGPYWTDARFTLEVHEPGAAGPRLVPFGRPFALIGRIAHADLHFEDRDVSARHVYLHADARGLFAVDLATRTGTRFGESEAPCGWLRPGESIEIAGRLIRVASFELDGRSTAPPPCAVNLLTDAGDVALAGLTLEPVAGRGPSWALGSELAFVGRGDGCAIRLNQANVSRTHCALLRTTHAAYVIDLPGQPTLVNGQPPRGATALRDGDVLSIGQVRFVARLAGLPALADERPAPRDPGRDLARTGRDLARISEPTDAVLEGLPVTDGRPFPIELIPPESRGAVLGWMLGTLHAGQSELLRRQDELQDSVVAILRHLQSDSAARLASQEDRINRLAEELRRLASQPQSLAPPVAPPVAPPHPHHGPPPAAYPPPPPRPLRDVPPAPEIDPNRSLATAAWLLDRIDKLGNDNKSNIKSFFSRLGTSIRKAEEATPASTQSHAAGAERPEGGRGPRKAPEGPGR
jgi:predicted component of type VI protein secretion system